MLAVFRSGGNLAGWEKLVILCRENVVVCIVYLFPPGVYVGTLNLITSIPGPSILTSYGVYILQLIGLLESAII